MNVPLAKCRWFRGMARSRIGPPFGIVGHPKVIVRVRWFLGLDILHPHLVLRHVTAVTAVTAVTNPVAPCPQVLVPITLLQHCKFA